ncbi:MAG: HDIG domain-containing protein [Acidobacteria bacterium]|nr:HDIG domain-containing protein [Acidobacteriota bacterium]
MKTPEPRATFSRWTLPGKNSPPTFKHLAGGTLLLAALSIFLALLLAGYSGPPIPDYSVGDIAHAGVVAPTDLVFKDEQASEAARAAARDQVLPTYQHTPSRSSERATQLAEAFQQCRTRLQSAPKAMRRQGRFSQLPAAVQSEILEKISPVMVKPLNDEAMDYLLAEGFQPRLEQVLANALKQAATLLIVEDEKSLVAGKTQFRAAEATSKETIRSFDQLLTLQQTIDRLEAWVRTSPDVARRSHFIAQNLLSRLVEPNLTFDLQATEAQQAEAAANADPVLRQLKKGKVIVRQGDEIHAEHLLQIDAIREAGLNASSFRKVTSLAGLIAATLGMWAYFLRLLPRQQWSHAKLAVLLGVVLAGNLVLLKAVWFVCGALSSRFIASPFDNSSYFFFALPFAFGAMLITLLAGERVALLFLVFFNSLAGLAVDNDIHGFFYILMMNLLGILAVARSAQRVGVVMSGFKLGLGAIGLFVLVQTSNQAPLNWSAGAFGALLAFLSGPLNAGLLVFALPLCERLFSVTTEIRLSELGNVNLPLLRQLILKAPGTYNHSIAVGTLSEGAAKAIGLNPLFARVACLYHDIGKSLQPEYFIENQQGENPHDPLHPEESVRIVTGHVTEGIRLAEQAGLPPAIVDIIPQHHGTKLLVPFYAKARTLAGGEESNVQEDRFRYPGPKPQSKEAAIIMLADAVEASARTLNDRSQERLLELIRKIVSAAAEDGQFSDCEITLAELERVTFSFLETLSSFYHSRITYPGFDFDGKATHEAKAAKG